MQAVEEVQQPALDEPPAWRRVWHELVTPSTALERPEERRRAALTLGVISTLSGLGTMLAVISVIDMIQDGVTPESIALLGWMTVFLALLPGLHKLARGPKHSWAAFLTVLTTWGTVLFFHVSAPMGQASIGLLHLAIPLFLSTVLLPPSATLFLGGSAVASTLLFPWLLDQGPVSMEAVAFFVAFTWLAVPIHRMREHDLAQIQAQAERLKESELRNRQMLHATFEGVVVHRGMEVVDANPTFAALFGLEHDQVAGTHMGTLLSAQGGERLDTLLLERHGMAWEATGMDVLGSKFPVECRSRDIEYSGETLRVTALRDITERRAVEAERTRVAEEAARRAELEQLVWLTSHALRTPVRTVNSFTQLLERDHSAGLGEDALEALSFIRAGSREMDALLGDLRTFAELTTRPTTRELVDVGHILTTVKGELTDIMQQRGASVGARELPIVRGD
ncbi:MAG: PAS domain S-box protein, partial [Candidatus Thermoplasmatota archaeon]|nr:PAS domain S-box protein [Candidatus Thermoplasmatota archaeon]